MILFRTAKHRHSLWAGGTLDFSWSTEEHNYRAKISDTLDQIMSTVGVSPGVRGFGETSFRSDLPPDQELARSKFVCGKLAEAGLLTPNWPAEYGGGGLTPWEAAILAEEVLLRGDPRGSQYMNVNWIGPSIFFAGSPEQKSYFLGRISRGDITFCPGYSEPDAGSDLAALKTSAVLDGDEYIVNGEKVWTSHTATAEYCFLLVRTDRQAEKHRGISILLVPMETPGLEVSGIPALGGVGHGFPPWGSFGHLQFVDMRVPVATRLGPENEGWPIIRKALAFERMGMPQYLDAAVRLDRIVTWAKERGVFSEPRNQELIGQAKSWCEASRLLYYQAIHERCKDFDNPRSAPYVARAAGVRAQRMVNEAATQITLSEGLSSESISSEYMRGIAAGIATGAYEIQLNLISRQVLGLS